MFLAFCDIDLLALLTNTLEPLLLVLANHSG